MEESHVTNGFQESDCLSVIRDEGEDEKICVKPDQNNPCVNGIQTQTEMSETLESANSITSPNSGEETTNRDKKCDLETITMNGLLCDNKNVMPDPSEPLEYFDGDSLPLDEIALAGCTGSDSGVEICGGRALSSGGGTRSCASSVVSCGSGCGSESSSVNNVPHKTKRKVNVSEPSRNRNTPPLGSSTPRLTVARGPNLATRDRARSREKPVPPEKPRPAPKPRLRPTPELPAIARESPALRVRPTRTSSVRCKTPNSPVEDKLKWPSTSVIDDKGATLPRRRREVEIDRTRGLSAGRETNSIRRPPSTRPSTIFGRSSAARPRVKIYAEISSQTVLISEDIERALGGKEVLVARARVEVSSRGVQADRRDNEIERLESKLKRANEIAEVARCEANDEKVKRECLEKELEEERKLRQTAQAELESNSRRLLDLVGGASGGGDDCLAALEAQLSSAAALAASHRDETDRLRTALKQIQQESELNAVELRRLKRRLASSEEEATEMQEFLTAEKTALQIALKESEDELEKSRVECRQLVRVCERKRQEALAARAKLEIAGAAESALDALARRLREQLRVPSPADFLDSETEPRFEDLDSRIAMGDSEDPPLEGADSPHCSTLGSIEDLSPVREFEDQPSEQSSLQQLSRAIVERQRSEADGERLAYKLHTLAELLNRALAQSPTVLTNSMISVAD